jgi:hypothetical protein
MIVHTGGPQLDLIIILLSKGLSLALSRLEHKALSDALTPPTGTVEHKPLTKQRTGILHREEWPPNHV